MNTDKKLEFELAKNTLYPMIKKKNEDKVRINYNNYINYLQGKGLNFNKKLFEYINEKYENYLRFGDIYGRNE